MPFLCIGGVLILLLFFYLLNTARKKTAPVSKTGKKDYTPVYVSIADKPDSIMRGMDKFVREVQKTESAGDKWRWAPMIIFLAGVGMVAIDAVLLIFGYASSFFQAALYYCGSRLLSWRAVYAKATHLIFLRATKAPRKFYTHCVMILNQTPPFLVISI
ncbi:MAG: hypothetical protein IPL71_14570 [Anaerolineales bacterium]|uniref:hypothetical protein n=1 Tax=Candidatus Villigracilis proximus TaxID=3140683 RepID=UPI003135650C|nr:hypothetical protein [Anaerolineales bacterium]